MPVASSQSFLQVLEKSSLLPSDKLRQVRQLCEKEADPKSVARTLIKDGALTKWQALQLLAGRHALTIGEYALMDQVEAGELTRVFLTRHPATSEQALLKTISRQQIKASPDAVDRFVNKVEREATAQKQRVLAVHRPTDDDERCFVVVTISASGGASAAAATAAETNPQPSPPAKEVGKKVDGGFRIGPIGDSDAKAAAPLPGGFAIETGPKRRRKVPRGPANTTPAATSPAATSPAATSTEAPTASTTPEETDAGKTTASVRAADDGPSDNAVRKPPMGLMIAGAAGAGLLLITGVVLTFIYLSTRGGEPVEVADAGTPGGQEVAEAAPGESEADPEISLPAEAPELDPVIAVVPSVDPDTPPDPVVPMLEDASPTAADTPVATNISEAPQATDAASMAEAEATTPSEQAATDEVAAPELASAEPEAVAVTTQDEVPGGEAVPESPPAEKKPPAPSKKPFADLAAVLALPAPEDTAVKSLGSVYIPEGELCFVKLRGGEDACKGSQAIGMRNADGGLAEREWEIFAKDGDAGAEVKIAQLAVNDQHELAFQWQAEAAAQPVAAYLENCAFSFSCAGESHVSTMRQPTQVEGMLVDFDKSTTKDDWVIESCPEPASVRVEIAGVLGAKYTVDPAPILEADKGTAWIRIEDGGGLVMLKVETSMRRTLQVSVEPHIKPGPDLPVQKFSNRVLKQYLSQATMAQQGLTQTAQMLQQALKQPNVSDQEKKRLIQPRLALAESQLTQAQTAFKSLQALEQLMTALDGNMRIKLRVFYDADSSQVDLLRIGL